MGYIVIRRGPNQGERYRLNKEVVKVGRGHTNDIVIDDNEVSREHLEFLETVGGFELHDLSSTKGTFINGQPVDGVWLLRSHCIIELGDTITMEYYPGDPVDPHVETGELEEPDQPYYLIVVTETQNEPAIYPLQGKDIHIGRSTSNDIVIVEPELSRQHFKLTRTAEGYSIEDLNSTNGTIVNDELVTNDKHVVYNGDMISIGTSVTIHLTTTPDKFTNTNIIKTDTLKNIKYSAQSIKRKTSHEEMAGVAGMMQERPDPTDVGTGVHQSIEDQILITYVRDDWEPIVAPLIYSLFNANINVWVDQYLIEGSNDWIIATEQSRLECWGLIVVVSSDAMESDLVRKNWRHFHNREKPIILLVKEPVERLPIGSKKLPRFEFNPGVPDVAFNQVVAEVNRLRPTT